MKLNILDKARRLEGTIARGMTGAAKNLVRSSAAREPIELAHTIVEAVECEVQSGGRGTRVFPFNTIQVSIVAPSEHERARIETIVNGAVTLRDRITERLQALRCSSVDLDVGVTYVPRGQRHWTDPQFAIAFSKVAREVDDAPLPARLEMTIVHGVAEHRTYAFTARRIDLGRGSEVRDGRHGLIRTNDVAFSETLAEVNHSVTRRHSHIEHDARSGQFRVLDDGSLHGTRIVRKGKTLPVPFGGLGVRLQPGDDIVLGQARIRVRF
jgi:hypothetical protein